jgi:uracil-DNA glycosylase
MNALVVLQQKLDGCRACPGMIGPVVHGPPVVSPILFYGQAPGPHEGKFGRPFAWTAGKTLFGWFRDALGVEEDAIREGVYMAAVARCFPGKDPKGGDRKPSPVEIESCRGWLLGEMEILRPSLIVPIGTLAIEQVLGRKTQLVEVVGREMHETFHGVDLDVICLPHPSGLSTWHRSEAGKPLLARALKKIGEHRDWKRVFGTPKKIAAR